MAKRTKQSAIEQAYKKERRRIQNFIRRAERGGHVFVDIPLPPTPKKITEASIRRLKKFTPKKLYEYATWANPFTGELMHGKRPAFITRELKRREQEIDVGMDTPWVDMAKQIVDNFTEEILRFNKKASEFLLMWLNNVISTYGIEAVGTMLWEGEQNGIKLTYEESYDKQKVMEYVSSFLNWLPELGQFGKDLILEALEEEEEWVTWEQTQYYSRGAGRKRRL